VSNDGLLGSVTTDNKSVLTIQRSLFPKLFDYTVSKSTDLQLNESCQINPMRTDIMDLSKNGL